MQLLLVRAKLVSVTLTAFIYNALQKYFNALINATYNALCDLTKKTLSGVIILIYSLLQLESVMH